MFTAILGGGVGAGRLVGLKKGTRWDPLAGHTPGGKSPLGGGGG